MRLTTKQRTLARSLRKNSTLPEKILWHELRDRQVGGYKFRRQHPIGNYVVDFCCLEKKLVIEVDGEIHELKADRDKVREDYLVRMGYQIVRFQAREIFQNMNGVILALESILGVDQ
jgi:very-short-patch-repair endonuclease